ncbi:DUF4291 family protein [Nonomuraea angiospora]
MDVPYRQIRAAYTDDSITVYQAYDAAIAGPAVAAQRFVAPFKLGGRGACGRERPAARGAALSPA